MRIFLSYSLSPTDMYIAALLSKQAQAKGIVVETAQQITPGSNWATVIANQLINSSIVIAIVSRDSQNIANVERELQLAKNYGKPVLALIEKGAYSQINVAGVHCVEFDRRNLGPALSNISVILEAHKNQATVKNWLVVGGLALLALYMFGKEE